MQVKHCTSFEYSLVHEIDGRYEIGSGVAPACNFWAVHVIDEGPLWVVSGPSELYHLNGRSPPLNAFRDATAFPSGDLGPVDCPLTLPPMAINS